MGDNKKKPSPKRTSRCTCFNLLYVLAFVVALVAGGYYYINHGCDLTNEHEEMKCSTIFWLSLMPKIFMKTIYFKSLLANWGFVDFHTSVRSHLDTRDINTTHLYTTPNITQVPVTIQEWHINGFNMYSYTPNELMGVPNQPAVIHLHGGGGIMLSPKYFDATIRYLANKLKLKFIIPEYPKSPEVIFPTAHEVCLNTVKYIFDKSDIFSIDSKRIFLTGDSFGAHAALYVAFKWNELGYDKKYAPLLAMHLIYPWVQLVNLKLESYLEPVNHRVITPESTAVAISFIIKGDLELVDLILNSSLPLMSRSYQKRQKECPELFPKISWEPPASMVDTYSTYADKVLDPYATFLFQSDFSHLPPTLIINAGYDILLSEGLLLKQRMQEGGVFVEHHTFAKMFHGFYGIARPSAIFSATFEGFEKMETFLKRYIE